MSSQNTDTDSQYIQDSVENNYAIPFDIDDKLSFAKVNIADSLRDIQRFVWDASVQTFRRSRETPSLIPSASVLTSVRQNRLAFVLQRVKTLSMFSWWTNNTDPTLQQFSSVSNKRVPLQQVDCALGTKEPLWILGSLKMNLISSSNTCQWTLQGYDQSILIDTSKCEFDPNFYVDGHVVISYGFADGYGTFNVLRMMHPPREVDDDVKFPIDMLSKGLTDGLQKEDNEDRMHLFEKNHPKERIVFLSDVHLDSSSVILKLKRIFSVLEDEIERVCRAVAYLQDAEFANLYFTRIIVLMGNFTSKKCYHPNSFKDFANGFDALSDTIASFTYIQKYCHFILIPGEDDLGPRIFPKPPILETMANNVKGADVNMRFASNPCRLRYRGRHIIISRQNLTTQLMSSTGVLHSDIQRTGSIDNIRVQIPELIAGQGHISPVPCPNCDIAWDFDYSLRVDRLPDAIIIGDQFDSFVTDIRGTVFVNTGNNSKSDKYAWYDPISHTAGTDLY